MLDCCIVPVGTDWNGGRPPCCPGIRIPIRFGIHIDCVKLLGVSILIKRLWPSIGTKQI